MGCQAANLLGKRIRRPRGTMGASTGNGHLAVRKHLDHGHQQPGK
jgi:hypothetical protein